MEQLKHIKLKFINSINFWILGMVYTIPFFSLSQNNLVKNPNCEIYDTCPNGTGQINYLNDWYNFNSWGSTDYHNVCRINEVATIPSSFGYQIPRSGNGYIHASIVACQNPRNFTFWTGQEYIFGGESFIGTLIEPLKPVKYKIEFYVSLTSFGNYDSLGGSDGLLATNAFDMILLNSKSSYYVSPTINQSDVIRINNGVNVIKDTLNWVKLSSCFYASGGETYFAIGAFRDTNDIITDFSGVSSFGHAGSYYFEDFSIYECDTCCLGEFPYNDHVNVSNNPASSFNPTTFTIVLNSNTTAVLELYDSAGRLVARNEFIEMLSNYQLDAQLAMGIYHYVFKTSNGVNQYGKVLVSQ